LFGMDSYAFKAFVCTGWDKTLQGNPLALYFFELMPCSLLFFKIIMFFSLLFSLWFIFLLVKERFEERIAWQSIFLLLALSPIMLFEFGKFENELLAYPFIVFGIYCFLNKNWFAGASGFVASLVFWGWPYYLFSSGGSQGVLEQQLFSGLVPLFGLVFVVPLIFLYKDKKVLLGGLVSVVLFLLNAKFFIFLMPFACLGIAQLLGLLQKREQVKNFVLVLAVFLLIAWNISFFMASPALKELQIVGEATDYATDNDLSFFNDWSFGYWVLDKGIDTHIYGQMSDTNYPGYDRPFVALTSKDLSGLGCSPINQSSTLTRSIKSWECK